MLSDEKYQETKDLFLRKASPSQIISEFAVWFSQEYSGNLLNFGFKKLEGLDLKYDLTIIVENPTIQLEDTILGIDTEKRVNIKSKFIELAIKYQFAPIKGIGNIENISICYFSRELQYRIIHERLSEAATFLKNKYPEISSLEKLQGSVVVIYYTDAQVTENEENGASRAIMSDYFEFLKKYDEMNLFKTPLTGRFVSKETLKDSNVYDYFLR